MKQITMKELPDLFEAISNQFIIHADELCKMDSRMGDGDLGITMKKGFGALPRIIRDMEEREFSKKIRKAGLEMTEIVPSTMGMLMGTGVSYGGKELEGKNGIDGEGLALFLKGFCKGIIKRGKCDRGDRTVLDSIGQAADDAEAVLKANPCASLEDVCSAALEGAKKGVEATKTMKPKYGKAAVHAEAAKGTADQGAVAGQLLLQGIADYILK